MKPFLKMLNEDICKDQAVRITKIGNELRSRGYKWNEINNFFHKITMDLARHEVTTLCNKGVSDTKIALELGHSLAAVQKISTDHWNNKMKNKKLT